MKIISHMKKNIVTVFLLCFTTFALFAQININEIPKGTNAIEIVTGLSSDDNYIMAGQFLVENGFTIAQKDKEFGYLTTESRKATKLNYSYRYKLVIKAEKVIMAGEFVPGMLSGKIENKGMKGSPNRIGFEEMVRLAEKIPHTSLNFLMTE
jgi:hypothetical protein